MSELQDYIEAKQVFGEEICQRIAEAIVKLGFASEHHILAPQFNDAQFSLTVDPYSQSQDLIGFWYGSHKQRIGQIKFHGDGSFYAEYDVVKPHPVKPQFFVEAIHAWGRQEAIKTEAKLLDIPKG